MINQQKTQTEYDRSVTRENDITDTLVCDHMVELSQNQETRQKLDKRSPTGEARATGKRKQTARMKRRINGALLRAR